MQSELLVVARTGEQKPAAVAALQAEMDDLTTQTQQFHAQCHEMAQQLAELRPEPGPATPRPEWEELLVSEAGDLSALDAQQPVEAALALSSVERAEHLGSHVALLRREMAEVVHAQDAIAQVRERAAKLGGGGEPLGIPKWFVCRGFGRGVPMFMRAAGRVRNWQWCERETVQLIMEVWASKPNPSPTSPAAFHKQSLAEHLHSHLQATQGSVRAVEWAYNLVGALQRFQHNVWCREFSAILSGELSENIRIFQTSSLDELLKSLQAADNAENGGSMTYVLPRAVFLRVVNSVGFRTEDEFEVLQTALDCDQSRPNIAYTGTHWLSCDAQLAASATELPLR